MTVFEKNLAAIRLQDPELAGRLAATPPSPRVSRAVDANGKVSITVRAPGGEGALRFPDLAAPRLESFANELAGARMAVVLGFGSGGLFAEAVNRTSAQTFVLLIEPDIDLFAAALREVDFSRILGLGRVALAVGEKPEAATIGRAEDAYAVFTLTGFTVIENGWSEPLYAEYFAAVRRKLEQLKELGRQNMTTLSHLGALWRENMLKNLPAIMAAPPVSALFGRYTGVPAFIVAAGPSLDKNAGLLAAAKGRALIIAVDTAARKLLGEGVEPDIVVSLDAQYDNYLHLAGVRMPDTLMTLNPVAHPKVVEESAGPMVFTGYTEPFFEWLEARIGGRGRVRTGGSVATSAFDLAARLGCSPIVFVGQDLSYHGGRSHTGGAVASIMLSSIEDRLVKEGSMSAVDLFGAPVTTTAKMDAWRKWFEIVMENERIAALNATEGGVPIAGAQSVSLSEAIARLIPRRGKIMPPAAMIKETPIDMDPEPALAALIESRQEARGVKSICGRGLRALKSALALAEDNSAAAALNGSVGAMRGRLRDILDHAVFVEINRWRIDKILDDVEGLWRRADAIGGRDGALLTMEAFRVFFSSVYEAASDFDRDVDRAIGAMKPLMKARAV